MILKVPEHCSYSVFDAHGNPLNWVVWADTETGEAFHLIIENGKTKPVMNEDGELVAATERKQHPTPLTYKKLSKNE